ncbi:hypothetical protein BJX64DRAFT_278957 [Aspergillus heterothallicus]
MDQDLDTNRIKDWRSIVTLVVFVFANIVVLFPFHIPVYLPRFFTNAILNALTATRFNFPFNFIIAPLITDLFLLTILVIGRKEVHNRTLSADNISPINIILFFYLYAFFFILGMAFLVYITQVSSNILHPRAWIYTYVFKIKFIDYIVNMIVPVVITAIILFPFLLYIVFADKLLVPLKIEMHELSNKKKGEKPVNLNIPNARGIAKKEEKKAINSKDSKLLLLKEILNLFLNKQGAIFSAVIMAVTLITMLALNAASQGHTYLETREIARKGREDVERTRTQAERAMGDEGFAGDDIQPQSTGALVSSTTGIFDHGCQHPVSPSAGSSDDQSTQQPSPAGIDEKRELSLANVSSLSPNSGCTGEQASPLPEEPSLNLPSHGPQQKPTLELLLIDLYQWLQEAFPTVTAVVSHMPFSLVPFAFAMFVLVQALAIKGWIEVFAYGWDHWVNRTGTIRAIGGIGFLSVILCNFAGTNISITILLSHAQDILLQKHIRVRSLDFAIVNLPIIAISMAVGCAVLVGEVYIMRDNTPYNA